MPQGFPSLQRQQRALRQDLLGLDEQASFGDVLEVMRPESIHAGDAHHDLQRIEARVAALVGRIGGHSSEAYSR
jgi:hypothetical protein